MILYITHLVKSSLGIILPQLCFLFLFTAHKLKDKVSFVLIHNYLSELSILWFAYKTYDKTCLLRFRIGSNIIPTKPLPIMRCVSDLIINKWLGNTKENVIKTLLTVKILQGIWLCFFRLFG